MPKNQYVNLPRTLRVDDEIHHYLQEWAARERRSVANLIGVIIEDAVQREMAQHASEKVHIGPIDV